MQNLAYGFAGRERRKHSKKQSESAIEFTIVLP
jgi:hypothetical protein